MKSPCHGNPIKTRVYVVSVVVTPWHGIECIAAKGYCGSVAASSYDAHDKHQADDCCRPLSVDIDCIT